MPTPPVPALSHVLEELDDLSAATVEQIVAEIPSLGALPRDVLHLEVRNTITKNLGMVLRTLTGVPEPADEELAAPIRAVMSRVEDRPSFGAVLGAYWIGARVAWERLLEHARPEDAPRLLALVQPLAIELQRLFVITAEAYLDEERAIQSEVGEARRDLTRALLHGLPAGSLPKRAGLEVAPSYVVLVWSADPRDDDDPRPALRRRRVRGVLAERFRATVLNVLDDENGGTALLPEDGGGDLGALRPALSDLTTELSAIIGLPVTAAFAWAATPETVPAAEQEAQEVLDVARRLGREPALYHLDDVALEMQLAQPGVASGRLVQRLTRLQERPELLHTLETYIATGYSRRATAGQLHVHPNTLDYRLARIADLTGLDPTTPADMTVLWSCLIARQLRAAPVD